MARPTKAVNTRTGHVTQDEIAQRQAQENKLKGDTNKIEPPSNLSKEQKKIFRYIVKELEASNILGNLDVFIISQTAIAISRLQEIEKMITDDSTMLCNSTLMSSQDKYSKNFYRGCTELSLSPASRAKIGNLNLQAQADKDDPMEQAVAGDDID